MRRVTTKETPKHGEQLAKYKERGKLFQAKGTAWESLDFDTHTHTHSGDRSARELQGAQAHVWKGAEDGQVGPAAPRARAGPGPAERPLQLATHRSPGSQG